MTAAPASAWLDAARSAASGPALLELLKRRLSRPYNDGPALDDRRGEGFEEIFEELAREDEGFRLRLEETIAGYFKSAEASPGREEAGPVIRGMLELIQRLALTGAFTPLRAWLEQHEEALVADPTAVLGRAALGALATSQPTGLTEVRGFWLGWWRKAPPALQPRAFIGLRLQDPQTAVEELPELLRRAEASGQDPGPLLQGLWLQPSAQPLLVRWLENAPELWADKARQALRRRLPDVDLPRLARPPRRPPLASLAAPAKPWHGWEKTG
jgi:hypothetical protein